MTATSEEHVLVIPAQVLDQIGGFEGFQPDVDRYLPKILASDALSFQPRSTMEEDPSYKQLIPYVILQTQNAAGRTQVFAYTRGSGQAESRLHAKRSIGIGGHISVEDAAGGSDPYRTGMMRELEEEVRIEGPFREACVGLIYDPSTPVGQVHLGIVHRLLLGSTAVEANEDDVCESGFVSLADLVGERDRLETWSQLCLDHLFDDRA